MTDLTTDQLARLERLFQLSDTEFDELINQVTDNGSNVKRFSVMTPVISMVREAIKKAAFGEEIWWDYIPTTIQTVAVTPDGQPIQMQQVVLQIVLGKRGMLLGPQHNVWFVLATDPIPNKAQLEKGVQEALKNMRDQASANAKAATQQMNGMPPDPFNPPQP